MVWIEGLPWKVALLPPLSQGIPPGDGRSPAPVSFGA